MNVYVMAQRNLKATADLLIKTLQEAGHAVKFVYDRMTPELEAFDATTFLDHPEGREAYMVVLNRIQWADVLVIVQPNGKMAHMEGGYAKGLGKKLYIYGRAERKDYEVIYGLADGIYLPEQLIALVEDLKRSKPVRRIDGWYPLQKFPSMGSQEVWHCFDGGYVSMCGKVELDEIVPFSARSLEDDGNCPACAKIMKSKLESKAQQGGKG